MPTLDEQFESHWRVEENTSFAHISNPATIAMAKTREKRAFLAGAAAERTAILAMVGTYQGENAVSDHELNSNELIEMDAVVGTCQDLIDRIRRRSY